MADSRMVLVRGLLTGAVLLLAVGLAFAGWAIVGQRSDLRGANRRADAEQGRVDQLEADYKARGIPVPATTTTTASRPVRAVPISVATTTTRRSEPTSSTTTTRPSPPSTTTTTTGPPPSTTTTTACAIQLIGRCVP